MVRVQDERRIKTKDCYICKYDKTMSKNSEAVTKSMSASGKNQVGHDEGMES